MTSAGLLAIGDDARDDHARAHDQQRTARSVSSRSSPPDAPATAPGPASSGPTAGAGFLPAPTS